MAVNPSEQMSAADGDCAVVLNDVSKSFAGKPVLSQVTFTVSPGENVAIIGPSGSGKTTLLRIIMGFEKPDTGEVTVLGFPVAGDNRTHRSPTYPTLDSLHADVGIVFQHLYLWPQRTVIQNIIEGPITVRRTPRDEAVKVGIELLERVGIADKANAYPHALSGGQQQRATLARALAMNPRVLLLDEITSALDHNRVQDLLQILREVAFDRRTVLLVTHHLQFAASIATRVVYLDQGRMRWNTSANEFFSRADAGMIAEEVRRPLD